MYLRLLRLSNYNATPQVRYNGERRTMTTHGQYKKTRNVKQTANTRQTIKTNG